MVPQGLSLLCPSGEDRQETWKSPAGVPGRGPGSGTAVRPPGSLTLFHELPGLLIAEVGVGGGPQAEGLPEQDAKAPHITLGGVAACEEVRQREWASPTGQRGAGGGTRARPRALRPAWIRPRYRS